LRFVRRCVRHACWLQVQPLPVPHSFAVERYLLPHILRILPRAHTAIKGDFPALFGGFEMLDGSGGKGITPAAK
jgi:hypothetical protein